MFYRMVALVLFVGIGAFQCEADEDWTRKSYETSRMLTYSTTAILLGESTPVTFKFYCNPRRTETSVGAIGFEIEVGNFENLNAFHFRDFEGPQAIGGTRDVLLASIIRRGATVQSFRTGVAGFLTERRGFTLEVSRVFDERDSRAVWKLLRACADSDELRISIEDFRNPAIILNFAILLTAKHDDFVWLLASR